MERIDSGQLVNRMHNIINDISPPSVNGTEKQTATFGDVLKTSLNQVNTLQLNASRLAEAFELGDDNVSLSQVMVASQKSSLAFQATTQIRNRFVSAYESVMSMQI